MSAAARTRDAEERKEADSLQHAIFAELERPLARTAFNEARMYAQLAVRRESSVAEYAKARHVVDNMAQNQSMAGFTLQSRHHRATDGWLEAADWVIWQALLKQACNDHDAQVRASGQGRLLYMGSDDLILMQLRAREDARLPVAPAEGATGATRALVQLNIASDSADKYPYAVRVMLDSGYLATKKLADQTVTYYMDGLAWMRREEDSRVRSVAAVHVAQPRHNDSHAAHSQSDLRPRVLGNTDGHWGPTPHARASAGDVIQAAFGTQRIRMQLATPANEE